MRLGKTKRNKTKKIKTYLCIKNWMGFEIPSSFEYTQMLFYITFCEIG